MKLLDYVKGYKTYIGAVALLVFALLGAYLDQLEPVQVGSLIAGALAAFGIKDKLDRNMKK